MNQQKKQKTSIWVWLFIGLVVAGVIAALIVSNQNNQPKSLPETITVQQAADQFAKGAFLLDVREPGEWNEAHVDGAVLIPLGELPNRLSELPTDRDILILCRSGNRSAKARDLLREAGMKNTTSISGGITEWIASGLPVVSGN